MESLSIVHVLSKFGYQHVGLMLSSPKLVTAALSKHAHAPIVVAKAEDGPSCATTMAENGRTIPNDVYGDITCDAIRWPKIESEFAVVQGVVAQL